MCIKLILCNCFGLANVYYIVIGRGAKQNTSSHYTTILKCLIAQTVCKHLDIENKSIKLNILSFNMCNSCNLKRFTHISLYNIS